MKNTSTSHVPRILMVDDEIAILRMLEATLDTGDYSLHQAETGHAALAAAVAVKPDIILLDLGLPDMDGVEVIRRIREWSQVPIIVLSVREQEDDKVGALNAGADDYLTKPFGVAELQARIQAALRRTLQQAPEPVYTFGDLEINLPLRKVLVAGSEISLTPTEYGILRLLATHAGKVLTHHQILKQIWGTTYTDQQNILRVNISHLRQKIESDASRPKYIITEPGVGYRLKTG
ncbi:DNA-binding response regulator [Geotalea uraniireducens]|uniref:DNA-binding response regulator n=1 Tax=Geotalea uraniireducens TaxID=351604 RepID=A0ABM8EJW1_9BACT|nr:response regulator transcription factor [Geotalea uraniireducens]BDV42690.1 DNA-binding response regulator [Geotalea uraniireducens]